MSKRLTVKVGVYDHFSIEEDKPCFYSYVYLDGEHIVGFIKSSEIETRQAAQQYIKELIEHFRNGGE